MYMCVRCIDVVPGSTVVCLNAETVLMVWYFCFVSDFIKVQNESRFRRGREFIHLFIIFILFLYLVFADYYNADIFLLLTLP